ncbi:hypothetical protein DB31_0087 [Hyalangium minutum]|uniref:Uncharacterized protein n=1 Tax=Hyalangium minutum TaxID=394096 RepID=A0A085WVW3_9BACT|nr:hypothetical protein DB31_0087 [Hyalangium minutum]
MWSPAHGPTAPPARLGAHTVAREPRGPSAHRPGSDRRRTLGVTVTAVNGAHG